MAGAIDLFDSVTKTADGSFVCVQGARTIVVPNDPANRDRQSIDQWVEAGGKIGAYVAPVDPYANFIPVPLLRQRIEALGMWDAFAAYLAQNPAEMLKVLTVETGVDPAYPALTVAFEAMDVPQAARDAILAPPSAGVNVP